MKENVVSQQANVSRFPENDFEKQLIFELTDTDVTVSTQQTHLESFLRTLLRVGSERVDEAISLPY